MGYPGVLNVSPRILNYGRGKQKREKDVVAETESERSVFLALKGRRES